MFDNKNRLQMEKMNKLFFNSRTTEVAAVASMLNLEFNKSDWNGDPHLTSIFSELKALSEMLTKSINGIKAESNLKEKDKIRDNKVKSVHFLVTGYLHYPDEAIKSAAKKVDELFQHYGINIIRKSYSVESSLIESLLKDFAGEEMQNSISLLPGLNQLIAELRDAETEFEKSKVIYEEEKAKQKNAKKSSEIKKEILDVINGKLIVYLRAMVQVDETKYKAIAGVVSQIIDDANAAVKKRQKTTNK